jgi:hypothetical protein
MIDPEEFVLPCDVRVPPATVIRAGCKLSTLILAMGLEQRPRHFEDVPKPKFESLEAFRAAVLGDRA